jgi:cytochrome c2
MNSTELSIAETMKNVIGFIAFFWVTLHVQAQSVSTTRGKEIFTTRCTACHSIAKDVIGPALKDVDKRRSEEWIISFVHSSQTVIKSGDTAALSLFNSHNKIVMPDHPDLSNGDITSIIAYINQESTKLASQPVDGFNPDEPPPYYGKSGGLHQLIFMDVPGDHRPLSNKDYGAWVVIFGMIFILILALSVAVRTQGIATGYDENKKVRGNAKEKILSSH